MAFSVDQIVTNIINQLKALDPTVSAEVGTPERKIIEATAEMIASAYVDFNVLDDQHDIDQMAGGRLDAYLGNFGFGRQRPSYATGVVTFSRDSSPTSDVTIPSGTQVIARIDDNPDIVFTTTQAVVLKANASPATIDAPVAASIPGTLGNVAANTVVGFGSFGSTVAGVTDVTNAAAMQGGTDGEDDIGYRTRFKNTLFRNMGGTYDQFLALAVSASSVSKANVVGPISRFQEYVQVPVGADAAQKTMTVVEGEDGSGNPTFAVTVVSGYDKNGNQFPNKHTSLVSTIPYSKFTYSQQFYLTDGGLGQTSTFYKPGVDFAFNPNPVDPTTGAPNETLDNSGTPDAQGFTFNANNHRPNVTFLDPATAFSTTINEADFSFPHATVVVVSTTGAPASGTAQVDIGSSFVAFAYTGKTGTTFTGCTSDSAATIVNGSTVTYIGSNPGIVEGGTFLLEHAYISKSSRNDYVKGILNCVEVFVNGELSQSASASEAMPTAFNNFGDDPATQINSFIYAPNYARKIDGTTPYAAPNNTGYTGAGYPSRLMPFFWQPALNAPDSISIVGSDGLAYTYYLAKYKPPKFTSTHRYKVGDVIIPSTQNGYSYICTVAGKSAGTQPSNTSPGTTFSLGTATFKTVAGTYYFNAGFTKAAHYAFVEEVSGYYGTIRARNGIEWFKLVKGEKSNDTGGNYTGVGPLSTIIVGESFPVTNYTYDKNISDLQAIMEKQKQITTDVLVHKAKIRYFRPYVTIMYTPGSTKSVVDASVTVALASFFNNQYYGSAIQLSDVLQAVHNVPGVDNVRWTNDDPTTGNKIEETYSNGDPIGAGKFYKKDFFFQDSQLAASPSSSPVVIVVRAANTWSQP